MMHAIALYALQYTKRHLLGVMLNSENIKPVALAVNYQVTVVRRYISKSASQAVENSLNNLF